MRTAVVLTHAPYNQKEHPKVFFLLVDGGGFGPPKSKTTDLQSAPFGRSGTHPYIGADEWNRTLNLLITSQLLCQLSYASVIRARAGKCMIHKTAVHKKWCLGAESNHRHGDFQSPALPTELPRQVA